MAAEVKGARMAVEVKVLKPEMAEMAVRRSLDGGLALEVDDGAGMVIYWLWFL